MLQKIQARLTISVIVLVIPLWQFIPQPDNQVSITISGIITGPGGVPVVNATVGAWLPTDIGDSTVTNSEGYYELMLPPGDISMFVEPPIADRLAVKYIRAGSRSTSFIQNIEVVAGYLISGNVVKHDETPLNFELWVAFNPISFTLPAGEWLGAAAAPGSGVFQAVAPPGTYWIAIPDPPFPFYSDYIPIDLTSNDVVDLVIHLNEGTPIPYDPPDATKISIGNPNYLGEAPVVGQPGSVIPNAIVLMVNLNSLHQSHTISEDDGSFSAQIFSPPGSSIMVKHGHAGGRWNDLGVGLSEGVNPFPGTIINLPYTHTADPGRLPFAASGAIEAFVDDPGNTENFVASAWAMEGSMGPVVTTSGDNLDNYSGQDSSASTGSFINPGDPIQIESKIRLYSQAITGPDVSGIQVGGWLGMMMLFNSDGESIPAQNYFMSNMLTPSGFPIQRTGRPIEWLGQHFDVSNLHYLGDHVIEGDISVEMNIPVNLIEGVYRPIISFEFFGVPGSTEWLAANVTQFTFPAHEAALPPIMIGDVQSPKLIWRLMMDDFVQGTRGTGAQEDQGLFELASQIVSQGAPFYVPPTDERTGQPITYRLEPFLPLISFTDRRMPTPPLIPFDLPGGELCVTVQKPDDQITDLGCETFSQSFNRTKTTRGGHDLNIGTTQLDDVYSLQTASGKFRINFEQYGHYVVTMTGEVNDHWGNTYQGGGTYDLWTANPLDIDPGILPGTPLAVGDSINPAIQINPRVPAEINLTVTHFPDSDPSQVEIYQLSGTANEYGYFSSDEPAMALNKPGEYRLDLNAAYLDLSGVLYMGALTWGGVVMTPDNEADLIAHGRRGLDSLETIPTHWFISCDLPIPPGAISHTLNPYFNGDIIWSRLISPECDPGVSSGGDSLIMGASVQDTVGVIEAAIQSRAATTYIETYPPGTFSERITAGEIPLFSTSNSGLPVQMVPESDIDQIAYSYRSSQRPGVRVREVVAEDSQSGGYWRLDTLYDDQLGVGLLGDQPNDFKFQYAGIVYRDLESGKSEYLGHGSGWVFLPDDDETGTRVMPPFSGPWNGGWDNRGGPILKLKGEDIHIFILPTGVRPGSILQVGDTFHFAGHIMPTLDSSVDVTVTAPSGAEHSISGQASSIGYFYEPSEDFTINEPGLWSVDVNVWHDGQCSGGSVIGPPFPSGDVLGSEKGRYWFYVVPTLSSRLKVFSPSPGFLSFSNQVTPITISGTVPAGLNDANIYYTISMPGYILQQGKVQPSKGTYSITFDPAQLKNDFPNLDLIGRDEWRAGLADTFTIGLLLKGQDGGKSVYRANTITIQGEQVFVGNSLFAQFSEIHLPLINKGD